MSNTTKNWRQRPVYVATYEVGGSRPGPARRCHTPTYNVDTVNRQAERLIRQGKRGVAVWRIGAK